MSTPTGSIVIVTGKGLPAGLGDLKAFCKASGLEIAVVNLQGNGRGRPRVDIPVLKLLDAYRRHKNVRATARELGIPPGTAWNRLKEAGVLYGGGFNLPDNAQFRPTEQVAVQPDFYYTRNNLPGICVFVDGPPHDTPQAKEHDAEVRGQLEDLGFRVVVIGHDKEIRAQIEDQPEVFGQGSLT